MQVSQGAKRGNQHFPHLVRCQGPPRKNLRERLFSALHHDEEKLAIFEPAAARLENSNQVGMGEGRRRLPARGFWRSALPTAYSPVGVFHFLIMVRRPNRPSSGSGTTIGPIRSRKVGANVGLFTLWLSARAPGIRVHCFEPAADTRERLMQNVIANCPADAVAVHPFAIFNDSTSKELKEGRSTGECSFYVSHNVREDAALEKVDCITLATALQFADADRIDLLKIDAEGAELEILASVGQSTMDRIERISLEYHEAIRPGSLAKILGVLEARGFTTFVETDARYGEDFGIGIVKASRS